MRLIVDLENVKLISINQKYINNKFVLSKEYRTFKDMISWNCKSHLGKDDFDVLRKFKIEINFSGYCDIDGIIKAVLDGIFRPGIIEADDRQIIELFIKKTPIKRGKLGSIQVYLENI